MMNSQEASRPFAPLHFQHNQRVCVRDRFAWVRSQNNHWVNFFRVDRGRVRFPDGSQEFNHSVWVQPMIGAEFVSLREAIEWVRSAPSFQRR